MNVKPYTGKVHMQYRALLRRSLDWENGAIAQEFGVTEEDMNVEFSDYASVCVQIVPDDKKHQKLFAVPTDSPEDVRKKFIGYMDLDRHYIVRWVNALIDANAAAEAALAPTPPDETTEATEKN